jgi:hypothetical protein
MPILNNIFINADEDISKSIFDNYKIKTRKTKLSFGRRVDIFSLILHKIIKLKLILSTSLIKI